MSPIHTDLTIGTYSSYHKTYGLDYRSLQKTFNKLGHVVVISDFI